MAEIKETNPKKLVAAFIKHTETMARAVTDLTITPKMLGQAYLRAGESNKRHLELYGVTAAQVAYPHVDVKELLK